MCGTQESQKNMERNKRNQCRSDKRKCSFLYRRPTRTKEWSKQSNILESKVKLDDNIQDNTNPMLFLCARTHTHTHTHTHTLENTMYIYIRYTLEIANVQLYENIPVLLT